MKIKIPTPTKPISSRLFFEQTGFRLFFENNCYWIEGDSIEAELLAAFEAHNPPAPTEPTITEKLASVGLSIEELKAALGGN
jgi:hypothetical protein